MGCLQSERLPSLPGRVSAQPWSELRAEHWAETGWCEPTPSTLCAPESKRGWHPGAGSVHEIGDFTYKDPRSVGDRDLCWGLGNQLERDTRCGADPHGTGLLLLSPPGSHTSVAGRDGTEGLNPSIPSPASPTGAMLGGGLPTEHAFTSSADL